MLVITTSLGPVNKLMCETRELHINLAHLFPSVTKLLAHIKFNNDIGSLWVGRRWSQRKAATPLWCSLGSDELPSEYILSSCAD